MSENDFTSAEFPRFHIFLVLYLAGMALAFILCSI